MDTAPLKAFATSARTELIREVTARITAVLSPGSPERVESSATVASLEKEVAAGGGGDKGKAHVADKVAYTWFNRIIALRFMDAKGYTGIGVVSPAADQIGQPEVLAAAKRGQIDKEIVSNDHNVAAIAGLLDGTRQPRPGVDAQAEAYSLLLAAYCRFWHKAMPFMFERQGDFTELLIPANLLAGDSVLNRSVEVLNEDACKDVEVIGWLYQFYISERKDEVFAGFKKNKKAGADEIPAATQLFTPHWIVRYVVENSLGRLWMLNRPTSGLVHLMDYYIAPVDEETDFLKIAKPEELKVIDPACGSGHMLTYAFDLLYAIYEEEGYTPSEIPGLILANNLYGTEIDPRAGALAAFALTMKARARQRTFFNKQVMPGICVIEPISFDSRELDALASGSGDRRTEAAFWNQFSDASVLGSLIQPDLEMEVQFADRLAMLQHDPDIFTAAIAESAGRVLTQASYLARRYHVVVTNPPYMSSKNMNSFLAGWLRSNYPNVKTDVFSAFIERSASLVVDGGHMGFMTPFVWMFISTYEKLRESIISHWQITTLVQLEYSGFDGATVPVCAFTLTTSHLKSTASYIRLTDFKGVKNQAPRALEAIRNRGIQWRYDVRADNFLKIPGCPIAYWSPQDVYDAFDQNPRFSSTAYTRIGLITGDNNKFIRQWWEVSIDRIGFGQNRQSALASGRKWFPVAKGGDYRKWFGNTTCVVNWQHDGQVLRSELHPDGERTLAHNFNLDDIFNEGVTWSKITSSRFSARHLPKGYIFNDPAAVAFPSKSGVPVESLLAYLGSCVPDFLLRAINPTLNFQPGNILSLPWPSELDVDAVAVVAQKAIDIAKSDWDYNEISFDFAGIPHLDQKFDAPLKGAIGNLREQARLAVECVAEIEYENNRTFISAFGLGGTLSPEVTSSDITLSLNEQLLFPHAEPDARCALFEQHIVRQYISLAVGCMFGRYSLDEPGLILGGQAESLDAYLKKVPSPSFMPDDDNVIPIVDGDWFEDDIVARFRQFLRVAFGDKHLEENLRFVTESLGVKNLREYFMTKAGKSKFYDDHVQRYKKRPIYWLFSSPKGSFNALIYLHRYTPSTASTVLTYLREYVTKLESSLQQAERAGNAKEADRLRKILVELNEYEHDTLYPKASENVVIDLDDGVKANYPKLGGALRKIAGLESSGD